MKVASGNRDTSRPSATLHGPSVLHVSVQGAAGMTKGCSGCHLFFTVRKLFHEGWRNLDPSTRNRDPALTTMGIRRYGWENDPVAGL
jgi:hypothetical protein